MAACQLIMAAGEGFEPSQTESESVVLPLHNRAILNLKLALSVRTFIIIPFLFKMSTVFLKKFQKIFLAFLICAF